MNIHRVKAAHLLGEAAGSTPTKCEIWRCELCSAIAPCEVRITYEPTKYEHVEKESRFVYRPCLADERKTTDWKLVSNARTERTER
jgi:hypothetical protein